MRNGWWKVGIAMLIGLNATRKGIAYLFGISPKETLRVTERCALDMGKLHFGSWIMLTCFGSAIALMMACVLCAEKEEETLLGSGRNALVGTCASMAVAILLGGTPNLLLWIPWVACIGALCGWLLGAGKIGHGGIYGGFGYIFGGIAYYCVTSGFAIAGFLAIIACFVAGVLGVVGYLVGCSMRSARDR